MSVTGFDKCKSIMNLVWTKKDKDNVVKFKDLEKAIYMYVGMDPRTVKRYIEFLKKLGWLKGRNRYTYFVGDDFMTDDF